MAPRYSRIVDRALTRLKLRQLRLIVSVGTHGSIQHAAREIGISQPAATKMIQDLEADFEVNLFQRTNRGVLPTPFGDTLIRHGKLIFAQVSSAAQELDDLNEGNSGRVVVGTLLAAAPVLLPKAIDILLSKRERVAIKLVDGTNDILMPALRSGELDVVVGRLPTHRHREELCQKTLFNDRIVAVTGNQHPLASLATVSFEQLKPYSWILPPPETTLRRQVDQFFVNNDQYSPPQSIESVSYLTNRSLLQMRNLVALLPIDVVQADIDNGALSQLNWQVPFGQWPVGVSWRSESSLSPAGRAFMDALETASAGRQ